LQATIIESGIPVHFFCHHKAAAQYFVMIRRIGIENCKNPDLPQTTERPGTRDNILQ
jgi:hypothetical protein